MRDLPRITKNLLIANFIVWLLDYALMRYGIRLSDFLGLHYWRADGFHFWQPLTYMFMHGNFSHIFCNMFAVLMFGPVLEKEWGEKKFVAYYLVCGLGAALVQECVWALQVANFMQTVPAATVMAQFGNQVVTIGASGAVFGILLAFGWLFPDVEMFLLFIPIPIRARTFVIGYAVIELLAGFSNIAGDNVAHFAHLGGMLFGWLMLLVWDKIAKSGINLSKGGNLFGKSRHTKLDSAKDKDYSGYHYQERIDD